MEGQFYADGTGISVEREPDRPNSREIAGIFGMTSGDNRLENSTSRRLNFSILRVTLEFMTLIGNVR